MKNTLHEDDLKFKYYVSPTTPIRSQLKFRPIRNGVILHIRKKSNEISEQIKSSLAWTDITNHDAG